MTTTVRVVSVNLHDYTAADAASPRREAQRDMLRALDPDVLCVQELLARTDSPDDPAPAVLLDGFRAELGLQGRLGWARSGCHIAILWRPGITLLDWDDYRHWPFHHTAGRARLDVGATDPITVISTHLSPFSAQQREHEAQLIGALAPASGHVLACLDQNAPGHTDYDPLPYTGQPVGAHQLFQLEWTDQWPPPAGTPAHRRAAALLDRHGLHDLATALNVPWTPTSGHFPADPHGPRRVDVIRVSAALLPYAQGYEVVSPATGHPAADLFDHRPLQAWFDLP